MTIIINSSCFRRVVKLHIFAVFGQKTCFSLHDWVFNRNYTELYLPVYRGLAVCFEKFVGAAEVTAAEETAVGG